MRASFRNHLQIVISAPYNIAMRIAMIPLDSRPPNWQFPQRLAAIARVELLLPPREMLGTLERGADGLALAGWLAETAKDCHAAVFSWDALVYGGLVQSRDISGKMNQPIEIAMKLRSVDWKKTQGYCFLTIPRLGLTASSTTSAAQHQQVRDYFVLHGQDSGPRRNNRLAQLEKELGSKVIASLWDWRKRNQRAALQAMEQSAMLRMAHCHIALEDNAPTGPHLAELKGLQAKRLSLLKAGQRLKVTDFDGADECGCLFLAKAVTDLQRLPPAKIRLSLFPAQPNIDEYIGRFESRSLGESVSFLAKLLKLEFIRDKAEVEWLVTRGLQPQPDVFADNPAKLFNNELLLPKKSKGDLPLFVTDLAACNGVNPHLANRISELARNRLKYIGGFNTNFNALGVSAALVRLASCDHNEPGLAQFAFERLADDVGYQSVIRPKMLQHCKDQCLDPFNLRNASQSDRDSVLVTLQQKWDAWAKANEKLLSIFRLPAGEFCNVELSLPWQRLFEVEATAQKAEQVQSSTQPQHSKKFDVLVAGGGMAGCTAALAAAREGASVHLVERAQVLGGNATLAMVGPWQSFHASVEPTGPELPQQVIGGIAQEYVEELVAIGASLGHLPDPIGFAGSITPVDSEYLQLNLADKLASSGINLSLATDLTPQHISEASQVVDATGSAVALRMMGGDYVDPSEPQPISLLFTMQNVDIAAIRDYQLAHPQDFVLHPYFQELSSGYIAVSGFFSLVETATKAGEWDIPRDRLLLFSTPRPGEVLVNTTRIPANHPTPSIEGLRQIKQLLTVLPKFVPGFENARLGRIAASIGQRESFRLRGVHELSVDDIRANVSHPQAIARGCYPVDIHSSDSAGLTTSGLNPRGYYDIPVGCLVSKGVPNLLCAGRCISADREGFASARVLPVAMATGQIAGYLAANRILKREFEISPCASLVSLV